MSAWWTCNFCRDVFWADVEPFNGHTFACGKCWTRTCPSPETCYGCQYETSKLLRDLDKIVNPPERNARWH